MDDRDPFGFIAAKAHHVIATLRARIAAKPAAVVLAFSPPESAGGRRKRTGAAKETGASADKSGGDRDGGPRAWGYSVDAINKEYALVLMGSKAVVFLEQAEAPVEDQQRVLGLDAFNAWFANKYTEIVDSRGNIKAVTWSKAWLQSRERRSYKGLEFHPDRGSATGTPNYLNLWSGFAVRPAHKKNGYSVFQDHLLNNVCAGDDRLYQWFFGFFAQMVQQPRERLGTAIVLRGKMGSGKTKIGEVFGSLFPRHYFLVDDPRYVTGQFNAHMASCLLLQADEAVWAGDKAAEGRLKGLVTAPIQQIEAKGIDPIRLPNYVRLIMTSNEDWVVPAGKDERRFAVLDVDPRVAQNHAYFAEMDAELKDGGLAALLADLLDFDLGAINLRAIPRTAALLEQKIRSLNSVDGWWLERLLAGTTTRGAHDWRLEIPRETLFDDYLTTSDRIGVKRKQESTVFGIALKKLVPNLGSKRVYTEVKDPKGGYVTARRAWCYVLPPLEACRDAWDELMGQKMPGGWPRDAPGDATSAAAEGGLSSDF